MLRGISHLLSPDLLSTMYRMGHGDALVLADAHFPGEALNTRTLRADGLEIAPLLDAILPLLVIDTYIPEPLLMLSPDGGDTLDAAVEASYRRIIDRHQPGLPAPVRLAKPAFYERARQSFAVVMTGDQAQYGNLILVKGVTVRPHGPGSPPRPRPGAPGRRHRGRG